MGEPEPAQPSDERYSVLIWFTLSAPVFLWSVLAVVVCGAGPFSAHQAKALGSATAVIGFLGLFVGVACSCLVLRAGLRAVREGDESASLIRRQMLTTYGICGLVMSGVGYGVVVLCGLCLVFVTHMFDFQVAG
jgi:hypothetical protein